MHLNKPAEKIAPANRSSYAITLGEREGNILEDIPNTTHEVKKYRGFLHGTKIT